MSRPLVSVITVTRNSERYVEEAIQSVLAQDYPNLEHVVVDGASTDGTVAILKRYPQLRWISEPDRGPEEAAEKGLRLSRGALINILNSDDRYCSPRAVSVMVEALEQRPDVQWAYGSFYTINTAGQRMLALGSRQVDFRFMLRNCQDIRGILLMACFFRRELLEELGLARDEFFPGTDIDMELRYARRYPPLFVPEFVVEYRRHPQSFSSTHIMRGLGALVRIVRHHSRGEPPLEQLAIWGGFIKGTFFVSLIPVWIKHLLGERQLHRLLAVKTAMERRVPALRRLSERVLGY
jgi:glycosyltransferase involved in cell wall biosynthesis